MPANPASSSVDVKHRDTVYRLIISQLFYDGHQSLAVSLSNLVKAHPACPPSDRLLHVCEMGIKVEEEVNGKREALSCDLDLGPGIDLEFQTDVFVKAPEPASYETVYVTAHKAPCRAGAINADGTLCATGSADASIKILDVDRMLAKSGNINEVGSDNPVSAEMHPVIRTLYDHLEEVMAVEFHPTAQILASGARDFTIKFFDYSKPSVKRAYKTINESVGVRCLTFHPSGDFLLAGTDHPTLRLYDVNTSQCFVSSNPSDQHHGPVTSVKYSQYGNTFVTSSKDGDIKLWDGVSNKCINTFLHAHDGAEVCSVLFARNGKYILSSGKDSLVKLWELSTSRCLIAYTGAGATGKQQHRTHAVFNHTEDFVCFPDENTTSLCTWDSRNAARKSLLALGHNNIVRSIIHSPSSPGFLTCSDDFRARFWFRRDETE